ncbi:MAG: hypothetical protein HQL73_09190 [Magnetococcales bacterium]|nr:hypothetical protein [Magnetococcales bacterium]
MDWIVVARMIHVIAVVLWIGGVAMVTLVLIPIFNTMENDADGLRLFHAIESQFATQARITTFLTALSGLTMLHLTHGWSRFTDPSNWWLHGMVLIWSLFTIMLFVIEPFILPRVVKKMRAASTKKIFPAMLLLHRVLLAGSLITLAGGVAGAHGWSF